MTAKIEIELDVTNFVEQNELTFYDAEDKIRQAIEQSGVLYEFGWVLKAYDKESIQVNINQ